MNAGHPADDSHDRRHYPLEGVPAHLVGPTGLRVTPWLLLGLYLVEGITSVVHGAFSAAC